MGDTGRLRLLARDVDHAGLLVDRPDVAELVVHGQADQAWAAAKVQQGALASRAGAVREISEQARRIRHPEPVVIAGRAAVEVGPEPRVIHGAIVGGRAYAAKP